MYLVTAGAGVPSRDHLWIDIAPDDRCSTAISKCHDEGAVTATDIENRSAAEFTGQPEDKPAFEFLCNVTNRASAPLLISLWSELTGPIGPNPIDRPTTHTSARDRASVRDGDGEHNLSKFGRFSERVTQRSKDNFLFSDDRGAHRANVRLQAMSNERCTHHLDRWGEPVLTQRVHADLGARDHRIASFSVGAPARV
jgi:hypothetical protein